MDYDYLTCYLFTVYRASCGCVHSMTLVFCCISLATLSFMFLFSAITYFRMSGVLSSLYFARVAHRFGLFHSLFDLSYGGRCLPKCRPLDPAYDRSEARRNCTPRVDCLCLHRRPTRRGCRAGRLVRQRRFPDDRSTTECDTETETDGQSTVKPIPVIQPSRRRSIRSAAGRCTSSSRSIFTSVSQPAALSPVDDESDNYSQSSLFSASSQHETTATSWCPSTLSSDD